jgi:glycyl-tRNA synthetase beta chain
MIKPLLIEIGTEELPAIPFLKELPNIEKKWAKVLEENNLLCEFKFYYTPRRLVFWHREFKTKQDDKEIEFFGAPVKIAYKDGQPTKAVFGFAKKCGVEVDELQTISQPKGEVLYYKKQVVGKTSKELLNNMINDFMASLNFGKSMRWGDRKDSFIRPIRNFCVVLGDELIDAKLYGIQSSKSSFAHRMVSYDKFSFEYAGDYFCKLDKNGVILYQDERRKIILDQMAKIQENSNLTIEIDEELLNEIVAITEYPTALLGAFDKDFLQLPSEVIIASMKEHQRYFACFKNGEITNKFIVVSNAKTDDFTHIIAGNEKVLRPRLADAMFFYNNDLKTGLNNEGLKKITFVNDLGSVYDKCQRETKIALYLADIFDMKEDKKLLEKTIMLSKADLLTNMVYEFTDLQGLMGYYYAKAMGEDKLLYTALKEQYLPNSEDGELPTNIFSSIVAIANKFDTIMGLFSIGMIPTGSRDPFALRRASLGIVRICIKHKLNLDFHKLIENFSKLYFDFNTKIVTKFFEDRFAQIFKTINPSVIKAVIKSKESDILKLSQKIQALNPIVTSSDFKELSTTFKRVANIIKDIDTSTTLNIEEKLLQDKAEKNLYENFKKIKKETYATYDEKLEALLKLKSPLDKFFDDVFVNVDDKALKNNRKNLIGKIYQEFKTIADIKEITI